MQNDVVELVFILDRSGSMAGLEKQTIDGFNEMIAKQKSLPGEAVVSTVLFDHEIILLHNRVNLQMIEPLSEEHYVVRGMTALYDAIGKSKQSLMRVYRELYDNEKPHKTLFVITTDGMENASTEFRLPEIKRMIEKHERLNRWEFLFLGANIDAIKTAESFGIPSKNAANFRADAQGIKHKYVVLHDAIACFRKDVKSLGKDKTDDYFSSK